MLTDLVIRKKKQKNNPKKNKQHVHAGVSLLCIWCRSLSGTQINSFFWSRAKHVKSRLASKWEMMIIICNQDELVCILPIS